MMITARTTASAMVIAVLVLVVTSAAIGGTASILEPITPTSVEVHSSEDVVTAVDSSGRVMTVYWSKGTDGKWNLHSALGTDAQAHHAKLTRGEISATVRMIPRALVAEGGVFHLLTSVGSKVYHYSWNGSWHGPEMVSKSGSNGADICLTSQGSLLVGIASGKAHVCQKVGQSWEDTRLDVLMYDPKAPSLYRDLNGTVRMLGLYRSGVPRVMTLQAGMNPSVLESWEVSPAEDGDGWTSPSDMRHRQHALDPVSNRVFAVWQNGNEPVTVGSCAVGATSAGQWQVSEIATPEGQKHVDHRLVSNGYGGVGLVCLYTKAGDRTLNFHWLTAAGPGSAIELVRPGTQTEAAVFESMAGDSLACCIDRQGTAHVRLMAVKRGETPAHMRRIYAAAVTGGPTASGGQTTTGGHTTGGGEVPKADFTLALTKPVGADERYRIGYSSVYVEAIVTNQGAEYYGDLNVTAVIDGAQAHYRFEDRSGHQKPLFKRGESQRITLAKARYEKDYVAGYQPSEVSRIHGRGTVRTVKLGGGLGRKYLTVVVDPDNAVDELDEGNNIVRGEYVVSDGRETEDREKVGGEWLFGFNDLSVVMSRPRDNAEIWTDSFAQRETEFEAMVLNRREAGFFLNVPLTVYLDGAVMSQKIIDLIDRNTKVTPEELAWLKAETGEAGKSASGVHFDMPLDLSNVAPGAHTLKLVVDPENTFADLQRSDNEVSLTFNVLPPGGTVKVRTLDQWTNQPIRDVGVVCPGLFAGRTNTAGEITVRDIPAGHYNADSIYAYKRWGDPEYVQRSPKSSFDTAAGQTTTVEIVLERPVTLVGDVLDAATGEAVTGERVFVEVKGFRHPDLASGSSYRISGIPPGTQTVVAGAYGYVTQEISREMHGQGETGECRVDVTLQRAPRATISGTVTDDKGHKLNGAGVWLNGAPRGATTDNDGHYEMTEVACDRDYGLWGQKKGYGSDSVMVGGLTGGSTRTQNLQLPKVTNHYKEVGVECCAWAEFEQFPGLSIGPAQVNSYEVSAKHGNFRVDMGVLYRTVAGRQGEYIDQVVVCTDGHAFWQSNVQSSYDFMDMFSAGIKQTKAAFGGLTGAAKTSKKAYGYFAKGVKVINKVYDYLKGDLDPNEEYNGQVYGDYTSNTGAELERAALIPLPSTEVDVGLGFEGGKTVVRVDRVVVSDASGNSVTVHKQWYSPAMWAYRIGENMDLDSLEVTVYLQVLNDRLSVGPLWATSRNVITWKPNVKNSLEMHPENYTVVP